MRTINRTLRALLVLLVGIAPTFGGQVLISQSPFSFSKQLVMESLFTSDTLTISSDYTPSSAEDVFNGTNRFVWLHGGEDDFANMAWDEYVTLNASRILGWVNAGGSLLLESDGFSPLSTTLGPGSLVFDPNSPGSFTTCGTLTAAGAAALPNTPNLACGDLVGDPENPAARWDLGIRKVTGAGLMVLVYNDLNGDSAYDSADDMAVVAGTRYGHGYIMYSGLTNSAFHADFTTLATDIAAYTASQATDTPIPEPGTLALLGAGLVLAACARRRSV